MLRFFKPSPKMLERGSIALGTAAQIAITVAADRYFNNSPRESPRASVSSPIESQTNRPDEDNSFRHHHY